eukprot:COSAG01_NODE_558_length_15478_cov_217.596788_2_plen_55_part_00
MERAFTKCFALGVGKSKGVPSLRKESAQANVLDDKFADLATGNFRQSQRRSHPR